ncbi:GGDEF domain-containing protein [Ramlibacter sp. G-1-2-2]|uniref:GGDEF domain-containing protein n=1 Tax=Ramlibacter agri TaxID=2728837 RepID=A0A848HCK3_9BURK|nr:GGDEF domain-containing protein [Ramlibacter agri]NML48194.1 GGDEF domain-containing protein [Ramlibacter agri]
MDRVAAGFWGAFFCTAALMLLMSLAAFVQSHKRVALMAALTSLVSAAFVVAYLGWLPIGLEVEARVLGHVAVVAAIALALMLMLMLGMLRRGAVNQRALVPVLATGALAIVVGWLLEPTQQLALGSLYAMTLAAAMVVVAVRGARRGDRAGWVASAVLVLAMVSVAGLTWIALKRPAEWPVHAVSALAAIAYLCIIARMLWARYSYLLELAEVMRHGPSYDPVTRMRSHSETGQLVGDVFFRREGEAQRVGVIAICIANLYALENLHGRAAFNHALFVCAGRLRRCVPQYVEMGRLGEDGFLLLVRNGDDMSRVEQLARTVRERLARPVALSTSRDAAGLDAAGTTWIAEVGVGVLGTTTQARPSQAVGTARAMARTAWSYGSRLARYDTEAGQIAELPPEEPREQREAA